MGFFITYPAIINKYNVNYLQITLLLLISNLPFLVYINFTITFNLFILISYLIIAYLMLFKFKNKVFSFLFFLLLMNLNNFFENYFYYVSKFISVDSNYNSMIFWRIFIYSVLLVFLIVIYHSE